MTRKNVNKSERGITMVCGRSLTTGLKEKPQLGESSKYQKKQTGVNEIKKKNLRKGKMVNNNEYSRDEGR